MRVFCCDRFVLPLPPAHRFPLAKYQLLREQLLAEGIIAAHDVHESDPAPLEALHLAHGADYVEAIARGTLAPDLQRRIGFPWSPAMVERSLRSVGGTIAAARAAVEDGIAATLSGGTHHAFVDRGEGFCIFNDVAVAARVLQRDLLAHRPAVVDCDVHQGNGTAAIFRDDATVFTLSVHGEKNFPFRKERSNLDVTLPDGAGDGEYLERLEEALTVVLDQHRPDVIFYIAGADPYEGDRLGRLALTVEGLLARDTLVYARCRGAGLPIAVSMGGGYAPDVESIVRIHTNTIREATRWVTGTARFGVHCQGTGIGRS